jgi:hypothetical protein
MKPIWPATAIAAALIALGGMWAVNTRAHSRIDPAKIEISRLRLTDMGALSGDLYNGTDATVKAVILEIRMCGPRPGQHLDPLAILDRGWDPTHAAIGTTCEDRPTVLVRRYRIPVTMAPLSSGPVEANLGLVWDSGTTSTWAFRVVAVERRP